ncbi:peptidase M23-like protein [Natranaerovirga pectinivora]|uniref:Peptidase M23-like protein n=1 Tax=Natranaerovirga pectinivora TaxID=682400 RepID=A0A4V2V058_9FIRM|nr:M23 family metallopeptidase [Natranaerovirga pectinivora]TCT14208.1 peptidase M23-like protein [Natranaerovirga pectinivora]
MIKSKRLLKIVLAIGMLTILSTSIFANQINDAKNQKNDLQERIEQTRQKIEALEENKANTKNYINTLDNEIVTLTKEIMSLEDQLTVKERMIENTLAELEEARQNERRQYELAKDRIRFMYEYGETSYIDLLLQSTSLTDFFNRVEYVGKIVEHDKSVMENLLFAKELIEEKEMQLENERNKLEHLRAENTLQKQTVERVMVMKTNELENVAQNIEKSIKALEEDEKSLKETEDLIKRLEAESRLVYAGGNMEWPVPGYGRISSQFGMRTHPIFKTQDFHNGIDIPAPTGTSVVAAAAGQVVEAGWNNSYGYYIIIDHGSGFMTLYAHHSQLLVQRGQTVKKWQTIAKIGSTGNSTGPHLHFSIRRNGEWINPLTMLNR